MQSETQSVTEFQRRVYDKLCEVPKGKVTTYKELAEELEIHSPQAVGQALKRNPFAPKVPCHRVVRTDGTIGGFNGHTEGKDIKRKIAILKKEGVTVRNGEVQDFAPHTF